MSDNPQQPEDPQPQNPQQPSPQPQYPQQQYLQQPPYPQQHQQQYPPQQYPQQQSAYPYSPYAMPQVHPMMYAQAQVAGYGWQFQRAGVMLMVTAGMMALCGLACGGMGLMPMEKLLAGAPNQQLHPMMTPEMLQVGLIAIGVGSVVYAVAAFVLGVLVRRQSMGATITAIVLTSLVIVYLVLNMVGGLVQMGGLGPQILLGECAMLVPLVLFVWQLVWLIRAAKSGAALRATQAQMQMQYWQYMAMQQQYQMMQGQVQGQAVRPPENPAEQG